MTRIISLQHHPCLWWIKPYLFSNMEKGTLYNIPFISTKAFLTFILVMTPGVLLVFWTTHTVSPFIKVFLPKLFLVFMTKSFKNIKSSRLSIELISFNSDCFNILFIFLIYFTIELTNKKRESQVFFKKKLKKLLFLN